MRENSTSINRRTFLSKAAVRTIELGSTIPLIGLLANNFIESREYYEANLSRALTSKKPGVITEFSKISNETTASLETLTRAYYNEYYESYVTAEITIDSDGNPKTRLVTKYRWVEPEEVPDHTIVSSWRNEQKKFSDKLRDLASNPVIDESKIKNISIDKKKSGKVGQGILSTLIYGSEIALLLGYEEISAHMSMCYTEASLSEKVRIANTPSQINRRSFFKVAAALSGATVAHQIGSHHQRKSVEGRKKLEEQVKRIVIKADTPPQRSFLQYFGITPSQLIGQIKSYVDVSTSTLRKGVKEEKVARAFENVRDKCENYETYLKKSIGKEVPENLGDMTNYAYITQELQKLSGQQKSHANLGVLIEGLVVGGVMAAILIPAEYLNKKLG
ncbi:MAG: hypothetical protein KKF68_01015 [Nanoarchaeota archaeon]|nr:hypothetical protein [Nanoarchaeota archaeon]